jgi:hypothetical protein
MAVDASGTGSPMGGLDLNSLLQSAIAGGSMSNLLGGDQGGSQFVMGALLGRLLFNNGNGFDGNNRGWDSPAQPQANMSIMSGIGDIKQAVAVGSEAMVANNAAQTGILQNQVSGVAAALTNTVTQAKDSASANSVMLMQQLNQVNTNLMETKFELAQVVTNDGDKTRALIQSIETANLNRQIVIAENRITELLNERAVSASGVTVTNNINQNQLQQQQQQQGILTNSLLQQLIAEQRVTQGVLNIGSGTVSGNSQTAANTRVS